jgi:hypothetical protein
MIRIVLSATFFSLFLITNASPQSQNKSAPKLVTVTVYSNGKATIGGVIFIADSLASKLNKKLWSNYTSTGKMYDSIRIKFSGNVLMGLKGAALDAILEAQQNTLNELCQKKYNLSFDKLDPAMQEKIKKQFPVLFQELHW